MTINQWPATNNHCLTSQSIQKRGLLRYCLSYWTTHTEALPLCVYVCMCVCVFKIFPSHDGVISLKPEYCYSVAGNGTSTREVQADRAVETPWTGKLPGKTGTGAHGRPSREEHGKLARECHGRPAREHTEDDTGAVRKSGTGGARKIGTSREHQGRPSLKRHRRSSREQHGPTEELQGIVTEQVEGYSYHGPITTPIAIHSRKLTGRKSSTGTRDVKKWTNSIRSAG